MNAIPSPAVTGVMLKLLNLTPEDKVLEIGTGSGSQTKAFAATGATVHSIELEPWTEKADYRGSCVYLHYGDGIKGLVDYAPFTAIVATCGVEQIPREWGEQLLDGGRLVCPIGNSEIQKLTLLRKRDGELSPVCIGAYVRFQMLKKKPAIVPMKPVYKERPAWQF